MNTRQWVCLSGQYYAYVTYGEVNDWRKFLVDRKLYDEVMLVEARRERLVGPAGVSAGVDEIDDVVQRQCAAIREVMELADEWVEEELPKVRAGKHRCPECGDEIFGPEEFEYPDGRVFCQECRDKVEKAEEVAAQAALEDWNAKHPIGTVVEWDGLSQCATDGPAFLMGGSNSLMVNLKGIGTVVVDACRVMTSEECKEREARLLKHAKAIEREKRRK